MGESRESKLERESAIRALCLSDDYQGAATLALEVYGGEILGFLFARDEHEADAYEAFGAFAEQMWCALPEFRWEASFRTWAYVIARRCYLAVRREGRRANIVPLSDAPEIEAIVDAIRTRTLPHLRTEVKSEVRRLREHLEQEDREMLTLRIDRGMSWRAIASVLGDLDAEDPRVAAEAARLRKRYERVKTTLRALARPSPNPP